MVSFLYCNKCSMKYDQSRFFLCECGHVYCERCVKQLVGPLTCNLCKKETRGMEISQKMNFHIQLYFYAFPNILEHTVKVYNFQMMHNRLYEEFLMRRYNCARKQCVTYSNNIKMLEIENEELRQMFKKNGFSALPSPSNLSTPSGTFSTSTPLSQGNITFNLNRHDLSNVSMRTPASVPGTAFRIINPAGSSLFTPRPCTPGASTTSNPSPFQRVPRPVLAPVHAPNNNIVNAQARNFGLGPRPSMQNQLGRGPSAPPKK